MSLAQLAPAGSASVIGNPDAPNAVTIIQDGAGDLAEADMVDESVVGGTGALLAEEQRRRFREQSRHRNAVSK